MNSFCYTLYVIVMLLRRREAWERGKMKAPGARWEGEKRRRGLFSLPIIHCALNILLLLLSLLFLFEYPVGASAEERGDRGFPKVIAPWIYSYDLY